MEWSIRKALAVMVVVGVCGPAGLADGPWDHDTLTGDWFGLGDQLADSGITISLSTTQIYQLNTRRGIATGRHVGRYTSSYDLEVELDLQKLLGIAGARVYAHAQSSFANGLDSADPTKASVGSIFGVNADAAGNRSIDLTELYYEQALLDGRLIFRIGKLDLTGGFQCQGCAVAFDGNAFANDETAQFLNGALVNNPTIPFPDRGLGLVVFSEPVDGWFVAVGAADARADARQTGFNTALHDQDYFFGIFETGLVTDLPSSNGPLVGTYRVGFWYDPQPKSKDGSDERSERDDVGMYVSFDQMVLKEAADEEDSQGLGLFARWGVANSELNPIRCFWSIGGQYQGLVPGRDDDVLGLGFAYGNLVRASGYDQPYEAAMEMYYNAQIAPWLSISPSLQYIWSPGGVAGVGNALVLGARVQIAL